MRSTYWLKKNKSYHVAKHGVYDKQCMSLHAVLKHASSINCN